MSSFDLYRIGIKDLQDMNIQYITDTFLVKEYCTEQSYSYNIVF